MKIHSRTVVVIVACIAGAMGVSKAGTIRRAAEPVPGQYLVMLKGVAPGVVDATATTMGREIGGKVRKTFKHASTGFSVEMSERGASKLASHPNVDFVEEVAVAHQSVSGSQWNPPWHLDRIDQQQGLDGTYAYTEDGTGVIIYVIGTGVYRDHAEFGGSQFSRVLPGAKYANDNSVRPGDVWDYGYWPCGSPGAPRKVRASSRSARGTADIR